MLRQFNFVILLLVLLAFAFFLPHHAFANGFRNDALLDTEAAGMANVFTAQADSPSAVQYNPAGIVNLKGNYVRIGYASAVPRNFRTDTTGDKSSSQIENFFVPSIYLVNDFGLEKWKFGLGVTSPYGLGTDWADDSFAALQTTESSVDVLQINPAVSYKCNDYLSVGCGIDFVLSEVSSHKRLPDATMGGGEFYLKGDDEAWGYNIGILLKPSERHSIGLSYRSKVKLIYKGTVTLTNLDNGLYGPSGLGVFSSDTYVTGMESKLTLPQTLTLGYAFKPNDNLVIEIDGLWTDWSSVQEDFVRFTEETDPNRLAILNDGNPLSKDWHSTMSYGIGIRYNATKNLTLRCGYMYAQTPVPAANFEPSMVDSNMHCVSFGFGYKLRDDFSIDVAYFGGFYRDRYITNDVATSSGADLDGLYESYVNVFSIGFTHSY